jgi:adenosine deaminase
VPSPDLHPVHRFIRSDVDLVIGADDPGIFDSPLRDEVDWVVETTHLTPQVLFERLGDPLRHRLGRLRESVS